MFFVEIAITIVVMSFLVILARLSGRKTGNNDEVIQLKKKVDGLTAENMELKRKLDAYKTPPPKDKTTVNNKFATKPFESNKLPVDFELTDDFKQAFELMEKTDKSIFLTGKAGTGKSTLVEYFRIKTGKKVVFLAPTGVAALNIGAKTIHSLFKFPPEIITSDKIRNNAYKAETEDLFRNVDVIVVDEISMVRADLVEGISYILQKYRDKDKPFGGVQMIFIGDMYQLPPVVRDGQVEITHEGRQAFLGSTFSFFQKKYGGPYFFNSDAYKLKNFQYYELNTNFRQKNDAEFMKILNSIREKDITEELLETINKQCNKEVDELDYKGITLCTTNGTADRINKGMMDKLKTKRFVYEASLSGIFESEISMKDYPVERVLIIEAVPKLISCFGTGSSIYSYLSLMHPASILSVCR
jgi:hypothetical protein